MTDPRFDERVDELIALAALGELDHDETAELERIAATHPEVAAEWREAVEAAASLHVLTAEAPPAALRASVLAAIAASPQEPKQGNTDGVDLSKARLRWQGRPPLMWLASAAAALALVVVGITVFSSSGNGPDRVAAVVDAEDAVARSLTGSLGGSVTVAYSAQLDAVAVTGSGVDGLPSDRTYQLWLVDDTGAKSVGVFRPNENGSVAVRFDGVDPTSFVLGVTVEPAGGSESPTLPIVASA